MLIAGVDEAGRGPLVGDVVAAAVILPENHTIKGIGDSKKLTEAKREALFIQICNQSVAWYIASATPQEIDELNILQATMLAMQRAVAGLKIAPDKVLIDGNRCPKVPYPVSAVVGGDGLIEQIGAASILAKVYRDRQLYELDKKYPEYGFARHKGYGTKEHLAALKAFGPINGLHRRSFAPVAELLYLA